MSVKKSISKDPSNQPKKPESWWTTLPGILTGIAAVIAAITGLIVGIPRIPIPDKPATPTPIVLKTITALPCDGYFDILVQKLKQNIEAGSLNYPVNYEPANIETNPVGITLITSTPELIAKLKFTFSTGDNSFQILSMINSNCNELTNGDIIVVKNGDEIRVPDADGEYLLRLKNDNGNIFIDFRYSPK